MLMMTMIHGDTVDDYLLVVTKMKSSVDLYAFVMVGIPKTLTMGVLRRKILTGGML